MPSGVGSVQDQNLPEPFQGPGQPCGTSGHPSRAGGRPWPQELGPGSAVCPLQPVSSQAKRGAGTGPASGYLGSLGHTGCERSGYGQPNSQVLARAALRDPPERARQCPSAPFGTGRWTTGHRSAEAPPLRRQKAASCCSQRPHGRGPRTCWEHTQQAVAHVGRPTAWMGKCPVSRGTVCVRSFQLLCEISPTRK